MGEDGNRSPMAEHNYNQELPSPTPKEPSPLAENPHRRSPPPQHRPSAPMDACIAGHQRELEGLLLENQRLAAAHAELKQDLSSTKHDLRHLAAISQKITAEKDAEFREVLERSVKAEAEFRALETFKADLTLVRDKTEKLKVENEELSAQLNVVNGDLAKAKLEVRDLPEIRAEKESIAQDIKKGRAALEVERNNRTINLEQGRKMEENKLSMIQEIDRLHAELANTKKKARATAPANLNQGLGYGTVYPSSTRLHGGVSSPVQYPVHQMVKTQRLQAIAEQGDDKDDSNRSSSNSPQDDPAQPAGSRGGQEPEPEISVADSISHQNKENVQQVGHENPQTRPRVLDSATMRFLQDMIVQAYLKGKASQALTAVPAPSVEVTPPPQSLAIKTEHTAEEKGESKKANELRTKASQDNQQGGLKHPDPPHSQAGDYNKKRAKSDPSAPAQPAETEERSYHCYNCGDPSHLRKDCDKADRVCRNCGRKGHMAMYCRGLAKQKKNKNAPALAATKVSAKQRNSSNARVFQSKAKVV